ncbi:MAG: UpxY family transcription antiterminator [Bacteroidales bacterium]|nr:UpxY family transcription antiterminator [Bacteroidales bacterium]
MKEEQQVKPIRAGHGKRWYAIYTRSRYEKRVHALLSEAGVEAYLPLVRSWRIWSDRKKQVDLPLLPSYLFVRTDVADYHGYYHILNTPGVVRFITFEGKAVAIPDWQIEALQRLNSQGIDMECMDISPDPGTPVKVVQGPMKGFTGEVISVGNNKKVILRLDTLDKCITLNIPMAMISTSV